MYYDPKMSAVLKKSAFEGQTVWQQRTGRHGEYTNHFVGKTAVSINSGEITSTINWGIDGKDVTISPDIEPLVDYYVIEHGLQDVPAGGLYKLRNSRGHVLAEARTQKSFGDKTEVYVRGKERADVVKLYEQIRNGETAPESLGGRRGLIRDLRENFAELLGSYERLANEYTALTSENTRLNLELGIHVGDGLRLTGEVSALNVKVSGLKAAAAEPKKGPVLEWFYGYFGKEPPVA